MPDDVMNQLRDSLELASHREVMQEALNLLAWATSERREGREVFSASPQGTQIQRVVLGPSGSKIPSDSSRSR